MLDKMNFHAPYALGKTRRITDEGYLLCEGVSIARTGTQRYRKEDFGNQDTSDLEFDDAGWLEVTRTEDEVFSQETIASFQGKPVTLYHPDGFVTPENWKSLTIGLTANVRRGAGSDADLLLADILVTDAAAVAYVNKTLPELSAGYNSRYQMASKGKAFQRNIRGNHTAFVDHGRAGPRCSIKDHNSENLEMTLIERLKALLTAAEAEAPVIAPAVVTATIDAATQTKIDRVVAFVDAQIAASVKATADAEAAVAAEAKRVADEAVAAAALAAGNPLLTADAVAALVSRAEILSPGMVAPTGTVDEKTGLAFMRATLDKASTDFVSPFLIDVAAVKDLPDAEVRGVFNGAAELMRLRNNDTATRFKPAAGAVSRTHDPVVLSDIHKNFWATQA
jgi:hypothetical protein